MKITIIGTGYVGLVTGACLAELGNDVFCLDLNQDKINTLNNGKIPIYEPGLEDMVKRNRAAGRLQFSTNIIASVTHGNIQFIAVDTPSNLDGSANLQCVLNAASNIGRHMTTFKVIVNKSTVPVGTANKVHAIILAELLKRSEKHITFSVISNPEFLKEGAAIKDFMHPDRIVIGYDNTNEGHLAYRWMKKLYAPLNRNYKRTYWMDVRSAEFTKYAANAMLATRISFMNELANLADRIGANIKNVRHGIGSDSRIGHSFLYAGCGYGGSCFPKDIRALKHTARQYNQKLQILEAVEKINNKQKYMLGKKIIARFGENLKGKHFAVWGLSFKPNTDDMREAPSRILLAELLKRQATVAIYDPVAKKEAKRIFAQDFQDTKILLTKIRFDNNSKDALQGADALAILTEWKIFRRPNLEQLKKSMKAPVIFDGRNLFEPQAMADAGFEYYGIGCSTITQE